MIKVIFYWAFKSKKPSKYPHEDADVWHLCQKASKKRRKTCIKLEMTPSCKTQKPSTPSKHDQMETQHYYNCNSTKVNPIFIILQLNSDTFIELILKHFLPVDVMFDGTFMAVSLLITVELHSLKFDMKQTWKCKISASVNTSASA